MLQSVKHTPVIVVDYDALRYDHESELYDLLNSLGSPLSKQEMSIRIEGFFSSELNHNPISDSDESSVPDQILRLYGFLKAKSLNKPQMASAA